MTVLLIGLLCFFAAARACAAARTRPGETAWQRERTGIFAAIWVGVIAALVLLQLWTHRDAIARYRFSLTGLRYALMDEQGRPIATPLRVSGDYDDADLYVSGAGRSDIARLRPTGGSTPAVSIDFQDDAGAIALIEQRLTLGRTRWRIPGAQRIEAGDTVIVRGRGAIHRLTVLAVSDTLHLLGIGIPIPWADRHVIVWSGGDAEVTQARLLPSSGLAFAQRLRGAHPSFFARSYPIADVIALHDTAGGDLPPLTSFFFYEGDALYLADVDSEVEIARSAVAETPAAATIEWRGAHNGNRLLIAALPLRDYPEMRLTLPERYGIRALRSVELTVQGEWLDATFATPEVQALDRESLEAIRVAGGPGEEDLYRIRVSHARNPFVRRAVVFESPPRAFAAAAQGVVELSREPRSSSFSIVTPSGLATAEMGKPLALGSRERSVLLRVDAQGTSPAFWIVLTALFVLTGSVFYFCRLPAPIFALALAAVGFTSIRLLLGLSAMLEYPFVQEGHQIGLWLLPMLPWAVAVGTESRRAYDEWSRQVAFHAAFAAIVVMLTLVLFAGSPVKQAVLSLVPVALFAVPAWPVRPRARSTNAAPAIERFTWGWRLGLALLLLRVLLDVIGWREGVMLGGTRIAVSVLYSPLALVTFAVVLRRHSVRIVAARAARARVVAIAFADTAAFLALAFAAAAVWISDFGIVLAGLPGVLLLFALVGARWTRGLGYAAAASFALPLALFTLIQGAPRLLDPVWSGGELSEGRMGEWNRNELLLLERGDPNALQRIGQRRSEALAVMRETMHSYTRGNWFGKGFLEGRVSREIEETATREHAVSALLASQWGLAGTLGLVLLLLMLTLPLSGTNVVPDAAVARTSIVAGGATLLALLIPAIVLPPPFGTVFTALCSLAVIGTFVLPALRASARPSSGPSEAGVASQPSSDSDAPISLQATIAALFLLSFAGAGLYMVLANYGLVLFTGKNVYLFGLDSVSDSLEGMILLAGGAAAVAYGQPRPGSADRSRLHRRTAFHTESTKRTEVLQEASSN